MFSLFLTIMPKLSEYRPDGCRTDAGAASRNLGSMEANKVYGRTRLWRGEFDLFQRFS